MVDDQRKDRHQSKAAVLGNELLLKKAIRIARLYSNLFQLRESANSRLDNYLRGSAKTLDLWASLSSYKDLRSHGLLDDSFELGNDWSSVGADMAAALKKFKEELEKRGAA